jgi:AraC family transcriptional regulator
MKPETRSFYEQAVQKVIEHIVSNLDEALDLAMLAAGTCLSPFHFHRVFRGMVGETPVELIRRLRMERAAWRLIKSDRPITEIAFDAGYETHEAFTRAFRACYSTSPSGFRHRKHPRIELAATCGVHFTAGVWVPAFIPRDSGGQTMDVEIKEMPELRVGTVPHIGPYNQIPRAFERLGSIAGPPGLFQQPGAAMMAIYHDDPDTVPQDQLRSDAAIVIPEHVPLPEGLVEQRIPSGRYACAVHVGPYEQLGDAWARFMGEWLPASGHRMGAGASYEIYRNDPTKVPKQELRTDMYISLA